MLRLLVTWILLSILIFLDDSKRLVPTTTSTTTLAFTIVSEPQQRVSLSTIGRTTKMTTSTTTTKSTTMTLHMASSQEEDLELTRQIIRQHEERLAAVSKGSNIGSSETEATTVETATPTTPTTTTSTTTTTTATIDNDDRPLNDLMIRAALGEHVERTPVWLFRQAGRHLPEYIQYKEQTQYNFLQLLQNPECVTECTLQPIRRYNVDAAILFSDILVVVEALNIQVTMPGGVGIQIPYPLQTPNDIDTQLPSINIAGTSTFVHEKLGHVFTAVKQIRIAMKNENHNIPLIGFSAAPWTLMYYMVGGSSKKNNDVGVQWLKEHPEASQKLLNLLTAVIIEYLSAQIDAGVHMIQIFEAMGMMIDDTNFIKYALPCLQQISIALQERHPTIPRMIFCRGACHLNDQLTNLGYHVITMDGSVHRSSARDSVGTHITLQGNYDPAELIISNNKTIDTVQETVRDMLQELGPQRLIANLGEGLGGRESPELVAAFVNAIHEESATMIRGSQQQQQQQQQQQ